MGQPQSKAGRPGVFHRPVSTIVNDRMDRFPTVWQDLPPEVMHPRRKERESLASQDTAAASESRTHERGDERRLGVGEDDFHHVGQKLGFSGAGFEDEGRDSLFRLWRGRLQVPGFPLDHVQGVTDRDLEKQDRPDDGNGQKYEPGDIKHHDIAGDHADEATEPDAKKEFGADLAPPVKSSPCLVVFGLHPPGSSSPGRGALLVLPSHRTS
ncbi:unnamed protein product [Darwinula stevensoni]|uniref:Uncharacterized protein n=1 Tax=Darwinula stevensoni TaxID=69355 RepID=A0A7R9FS44_9CRUS|nr:unnamed protein product [Darwinula stevensoni]CAG0902548.1 unnamed protein product [Darwinula stevensoni]